MGSGDAVSAVLLGATLSVGWLIVYPFGSCFNIFLVLFIFMFPFLEYTLFFLVWGIFCVGYGDQGGWVFLPLQYFICLWYNLIPKFCYFTAKL